MNGFSAEGLPRAGILVLFSAEAAGMEVDDITVARVHNGCISDEPDHLPYTYVSGQSNIIRLAIIRSTTNHCVAQARWKLSILV